jgi:hypothetical protein
LAEFHHFPPRKIPPSFQNQIGTLLSTISLADLCTRRQSIAAEYELRRPNHSSFAMGLLGKNPEPGLITEDAP